MSNYLAVCTLPYLKEVSILVAYNSYLVANLCAMQLKVIWLFHRSVL